MQIPEPVHVEVLPSLLTVVAVQDPYTFNASLPDDHPYLDEVWLPLVGPSAKAVLHRLVCMASDQRSTSTSVDQAGGREFVVDVERLVEELDLQPGLGAEGELLPILQRFAVWGVFGFLVNSPVTALLAPTRIPLAPASVVAAHSRQLLEIHNRYCRERLDTFELL